MKSGKRYTPGRTTKLEDGSPKQLVPASAKDPGALAQVVDQFVLHYDVCGASERCFMVLHDDRELSVQFLLDVDGTIYQTMDVRDQAWHAGLANTRSIGVEIAQIGAYPEEATGPLDAWYERDGLGPYVSLDRLEPWHIRTEGFIARPRNRELQRGLIHGTEYVQYDFTPEQYDSLVKLTAALARALPGLEIDAPRDRVGKVRSDVLSAEEYDAFRGILGHFHISGNKRDPGPAFDWERYLRAVRREVARP
jgi:N-acetyl-anhydromuramyl-L-alanine amidase AmpD